MKNVIPLFIDGTAVGVVGMDITTEILYENTKSVKVYETGYAFLMDNDGNFVYHPEMKSGVSTDTFNEAYDYLYRTSLLSAENQTVEKYQWKYEDKRLCAQSLKNGMLFSVCISEDEIMQTQNRMLTRSAVVILLIISLFIYWDNSNTYQRNSKTGIQRFPYRSRKYYCLQGMYR